MVSKNRSGLLVGVLVLVLMGLGMGFLENPCRAAPYPFEWGAEWGVAPLLVRFNALEEGDQYIWTFGDGTPVVSVSRREVLHTFRNPGTYDVTLRVIYGEMGGKQWTVSQCVRVLQPSGSVVATLYWCNWGDNTIRMLRSDGRKTPLPSTVIANAPDVAGPTGLAVFDGYVVWGNYSTNTIRVMKIGAGPGSSVPVVDSKDGVQNPSGLHVVERSGGYDLYWANQVRNSICRVQIDSSGQVGPTTILVEAHDRGGVVYNPWGIFVAGDYLYWANAGDRTIRRCSIVGTSFPVSSTTTIANAKTGVNGPVDVRVMGPWLCWTQVGDNTIRRCRLDSGFPARSSIVMMYASDGIDNPVGLVLTSVGGMGWANAGDNTLHFCDSTQCSASDVVAGDTATTGVDTPGFMRWTLP